MPFILTIEQLCNKFEAHRNKRVWWIPQGTQKLRLIGTDDAWWGTVGNKFGMVGMDNGGC